MEIRSRIFRFYEISKEEGIFRLVEEIFFFVLRRFPFIRDYSKVIERDYKDCLKLPWGDYSYLEFFLLEIRLLYGVLRGEEYSLKRSLQVFNKSDNVIIDLVYDYKGFGRYHLISPMQVKSEVKELRKTISKRDVESVLEIGSARNGTLAIWAAEESCKHICSIDLPESDERRTTLDKVDLLDEIFTDTEFSFIRGNSHSQSTMQELENSLSSKVDFIFIDADHTYKGVKSDFETYKQFLKDEGIIAFHDIKNDRFGVRDFWQEIKQDYETKEIVDEEIIDKQGIGVVYL